MLNVQTRRKDNKNMHCFDEAAEKPGVGCPKTFSGAGDVGRSMTLC